MRIALVHDWLVKLGGAERVLIELHSIFPEAPIYTLFYDKKFISEWLPYAEVRPSFLQKIPLIRRRYPFYTMFMPAGVESFNLSSFDTVLSSSAIFSKGLILRPGTRHICYCYSPSRMLWDRNIEYERKGLVSGTTRHLLRIWDRSAADRVDEFVAISETVSSRIKKYYNRDARVIYPPLKRFAPENPYTGMPIRTPRLGLDYFLIVSRLFPHKNIDIAVEAFEKLGYNLAIAGDGPLRKKLETKAKKNIFFLGEINDATLATCYENCRALVMPQEEDFGLTSVEAMSFGKPVLALRRGGALETVKEGISGEFFDDPIPEALADGVKRLNQNYAYYNPDEIIGSTERFSADTFRQKISEMIK